MNEHFVTLNDAELEQAAGGVTVSLTLDKNGGAVSGPLGDIKLPNPFAVVRKTVGGVLGKTGDLLSTAGGALTALGHLFDFG